MVKDDKIFKYWYYICFMGKINQLTETSKEFLLSKSLEDKSYVIDTEFIKVVTFYLGMGGTLGGDSFVLRTDDPIALSLIGDIEGYGSDGRIAVNKYCNKIQDLVESLAILDQKSITEKLIFLDGVLAKDRAMAVSLLRISLNGDTHYLNIGENTMYICVDQEVRDVSMSPGGKLGWFQKTLKWDKDIMASEFTLKNFKAKNGDRIFLGSDGVTTYLEDEDYDTIVIPRVKDSLKNADSLEKFVSDINIHAHNMLIQYNKTLPDDYTIMSLEFKNT